MFRDFGRKLQRDIKRTVDARLKQHEDLSEGRIKPKPIDVQVEFFFVRKCWLCFLLFCFSLLMTFVSKLL